MRGAARELTRTRTHTYAELGGMTRRLPVDRAFLYLGGGALSCSMPRTPRRRWAPWRRRPLGQPAVDLLPQRVKRPSHATATSGGPGSSQCPIIPLRVSWLPWLVHAPKFWGQHTSYGPVSTASRNKNVDNCQFFDLNRSRLWHRISSCNF